MSKFQLMLTSLIAVIPGALLVYVLLMALLVSEGPPLMAYVFMGVTLIAAVVTTLIPAGIMVGGRKAAVTTPAKKSEKPKLKIQSSEEIELLDDEAALLDQSGESVALEMEDASPEFELDDAEIDASEIAEETIDTEPVEEFEGLEMDEDIIEFEDDEPPKKNKKR